MFVITVASGTNHSLQDQLSRDVDECKVAIKKLAESVTTVKNVLDRKINEEIRSVIISNSNSNSKSNSNSAGKRH